MSKAADRSRKTIIIPKVILNTEIWIIYMKVSYISYMTIIDSILW